VTSEARARFEHINDEDCRQFQAAIELVGRRWSAAILLATARRGERFSEIRQQVKGISEPVLSQRLKELEHAHLIERTVVPTTPVQIKYALTDRGRELLTGLMPLIRWGQKWDPISTGPR
jgi:DNA-binding HxlR family transcriptional regulator